VGFQVSVAQITVFGSLAESLNNFSDQNTDFVHGQVGTVSIPLGFNEVSELNGIDAFGGGVADGNAGLISGTSRGTHDGRSNARLATFTGYNDRCSSIARRRGGNALHHR